MSSNLPSDDLERVLRWTLRDLVGQAEPSPAAWEGIRRRIGVGNAHESSAGGGLLAWLAPTVQALTLGAILAVVGLHLARGEVSRFSLALQAAQAPVARPSALVTDKADLLSARLLWLDGRAAVLPQRPERRRGLIE